MPSVWVTVEEYTVVLARVTVPVVVVVGVVVVVVVVAGAVDVVVVVFPPTVVVERTTTTALSVSVVESVTRAVLVRVLVTVEV